MLAQIAEALRADAAFVRACAEHGVRATRVVHVSRPVSPFDAGAPVLAGRGGARDARVAEGGRAAHAVELYDHRDETSYPTDFDVGERQNVAANFSDVVADLAVLVRAQFDGNSSDGGRQ